MKQSDAVIITWIVLWTLMSIATIYFRKYPYQWTQENIDHWSWLSNTWEMITHVSWKIGWSWENISENIWEYTKELIINQEWYKTLDLDNFPVIKVNNPIKNVRLIAEISFTDNFMKTYKYEDSTWYFFALKFFIWDLGNWWYYNVYRKENWGLWNSANRGLVWAKLAYEVRDWAIWYIDLTDKVPIAVDTEKWRENYQFTYIDMINYINSHLWSDLPIWVYLSSVTEKQWREITKIKSLKLVYIWKVWDVEIISN